MVYKKKSFCSPTDVLSNTTSLFIRGRRTFINTLKGNMIIYNEYKRVDSNGVTCMITKANHIIFVLVIVSLSMIVVVTEIN